MRTARMRWSRAVCWRCVRDAISSTALAVDPVLRKEGLGKLLVDKVKQEVQARGGDAIYLVARAPGFFRRLGFETIDPQNAPNFFECKQCPQYQVSCHPEVMKLTLSGAESAK